jgi:ACS family glucarate transporter-like MFS transporter
MRRGWIALFLFSLTGINYLDRLALSMAAKPISGEFHLTPVQMGYLFSAYLWAYLLFSIPSGLLVDRFGAKRVAGFGIGIWSAATACTGLGFGYVSLMLSRFVMGGGEAVTNPSGARIIREWFPANERGTANAIFNAGAFAGPALSAVTLGLLIEWAGWRPAFISAAAVGFVWLVAWWFFYAIPERAAWLSGAERDKIVAGRGHGSAPLVQIGLPALLRTRTLWGLALIGGADAYCSYLFLAWLPTYLQTTRHLAMSTMGLYTAVPYAAALCLSLTVAQLSDRFLQHTAASPARRRYVIAGSSLLAAAAIVGVPLAEGTIALLALMSLAIGCLATNTAQVFALTSDLLATPGDIGKVMSFEVAAANIIGMLSPIVTGYIVGFAGSFTAAFVTAGGVILLAAVAALTIATRPMVAGSAYSYHVGAA